MNQKYQTDIPVENNQQEITAVPPAASSLVSPFSPRDVEVGNSVMGTIEQRQQSLGKNTPLFKKSCGSYKK